PRPPDPPGGAFCPDPAVEGVSDGALTISQRLVGPSVVLCMRRPPSASEALAESAAGLRIEDIPTAVRAAAKRHLLDVVGVALASSPLPFARMALQAATALGGPGDRTVIGFADRLPPVWAALVNGALAHGIDYDDTHEQGVVHVGCSGAPAGLAGGECQGGSCA